MIPELEIFVALLELAGLSDMFLCPGPFTCLAPTNDAFDALGPDVVDVLLDPDNINLLQDVLLYHLVPNLFLEADFENGSTLPTLLSDFTIDVSTNISSTFFNVNASLVDPDNFACNGVIHILDSVLIPGT